VCARWSRLALQLIFCLFAIRTQAERTNIAATLIPFDRLTVTDRLLVRGVTDHYTLRREYKPQQFKARKEHLEFLMDHLEACSVLAQSVGLIRYRATREADGRVYADDREGAAGYIAEALSPAVAGGKRVYYVEGTQRGLFDVRGRGVAVVDYVQVKSDAIEYTGALFVKVDNAIIAALTQLFAVFLRGTVDHQFEHVMRQPIALSKMALTDPQRLLDQIGQMPNEDKALLQPFAEMLRSTTRPNR
jgi:hypothetical protein